MVPFSLLLPILQTLILISTNSYPIPKIPPQTNPTQFPNSNGSSKLSNLLWKTNTVLLQGNSTIYSRNKTFQLSFYYSNGGAYLAIMYSSIQVPTVVWVANRDRPVKNITSATLEITATGILAVKDSDNSTVWTSHNSVPGAQAVLLESGNLVLLTHSGKLAWQSFDHPTDTWLPGMNLTADRGLTSWRTAEDPSPGLYSLRLRPLDYGEFELVFNGSVEYWSTGMWNGQAFANVPEMAVPYIYTFHFMDAYKPTASFWFTERASDGGPNQPLTRFQIDHSGQLRQYTWGLSEAWDRFWSRPEDKCSVVGLCGKFGVCDSEGSRPCECPPGFKPVDESSWECGEYSGGCERFSDVGCEGREDGFVEVGVESLAGSWHNGSISGRDGCERVCLQVCSCIGFQYNERSGLCKHYFGVLSNLRNVSSDGNSGMGGGSVLNLKVRKGVILKSKKGKEMNYTVFSVSIVGSIAVLGFVLVVVLIRRRTLKRNGGADEGVLLPVLNLKVFSYKELHTATRGFKEKLGHGGFGAVFLGELSDLTLVAVKRLERPGSGEQQFRAEVCTIGNIQHVNLVRLRGFCSEDSHRLLVYDYMPNGPLSVYLRRDGPNLSWDVRFRLAVGTARGIAYLHEGCRDSIIHCDIKPENILLDSDYTAKVSDFGLAKLIHRDFSGALAADGHHGYTYGYVAPECRPGDPITTKADVYSYGKTLLELLGGHRMWETPPSVGGREGGNEITDSWCFPLWAAQQIIDGNVVAVIDDRLGSKYNLKEAERVALVAVWCIQDDEATRPTMGMVVTMLEGVVEVTVPPAPKLLQALVSGESFCGVNSDSGHSASLASDDFSGCNTRLSSCGSESSLGNVSSLVNENAHENQRTSVSFTVITDHS
ncbi:PREDICTED: G-type lectin S-receptor-like serine/threonine-protein kinase SD2-2 [Fragaria vesca subsp. vesca]|uniref:G-type lectin S-receptor-like serine/threonine-protein kinase SD2-2 n=1 Tax=Fragaria vesca subsp. vesca TaxID=101020 RepID=UPI0002C34AE6|nr:PREDICTED: G-type lectin S-receptor-like serine/threonine-protein kinase SD2-2 [Fragaria vesca subsp. vesca]